MSPSDLEQYLYAHIPLSRAMAVRVMLLEPEAVVLQAPLAPNINHRETAFGGSVSALAILSAWSLLHSRLRAQEITSRLVIQRNRMEYERPICGEFTARASLDRPDSWRQFLRMLSRKGRARIEVASCVAAGGETCGRFSGEFVALGYDIPG